MTPQHRKFSTKEESHLGVNIPNNVNSCIQIQIFGSSLVLIVPLFKV
jgi:hypothetical protein